MTDSGTGETRLWLLRHPQPEAAAVGRCYGSLDVALSPEGLHQARAISKALALEPFAAVYTSPRRRCIEAAYILACGRHCTVEIVEALRELDFGELEGRSYEEIAEVYPTLYRQWMEQPTKVKFPGGESLREMASRVAAAVSDLRSRHHGRSIALMTHGGVIRIILAEALGMERVNIFRLGQRYGAVNLVRYFGETPTVELLNAEVT